MDQNIPNYSLTTPEVTVPPFEPEQTKKNNTPILYFTVIILVVIVAFTAIILFQSSQNTKSANLNTNSVIPTVIPTTVSNPAVQADEIFPTESANPFNDPEAYQNPFESTSSTDQEYQNPFNQQ